MSVSGTVTWRSLVTGAGILIVGLGGVAWNDLRADVAANSSDAEKAFELAQLNTVNISGLVADADGNDDLRAELVKRFEMVAAGNKLTIEELLAMAREAQKGIAENAAANRELKARFDAHVGPSHP